MHYVVEGTAAELFQKFQAGLIPPSAKVEVMWEEITVINPATKEPIISVDRTLALREQWKKQDAALTQEEQAEEDIIYAEIERNGIPRLQLRNVEDGL